LPEALATAGPAAVAPGPRLELEGSAVLGSAGGRVASIIVVVEQTFGRMRGVLLWQMGGGVRFAWVGGGGIKSQGRWGMEI